MSIRQHDLTFEGMKVHCYEGGNGYPIVLVHGSGPGTASASNWGRVLEPLAEHYHVCAVDLIGYGLSGRKPSQPYFDLDLWTRQVCFALDHVAQSGSVGLIGHSLGGAIALRAALASPRIDKLLLQGSLGASFPIPEAIEVSWSVPKDAVAFRDFYERVIGIKGDLPDSFIAERLAICRKDGYDTYFNAMFDGDKQAYLDRTVLPPEHLALLKAKVLMLYGDADTCAPFEGPGLALANAIKQADIVRLANCGHPCSFDAADRFLGYAKAFFG